METSFIPTLADSRITFGVVTVGGIAMCMRGIGKAAELGLWIHPVTIAGYVLGALALLLCAQGLFHFRLIPVSNAWALAAIFGIVIVKFLLATLYRA